MPDFRRLSLVAALAATSLASCYDDPLGGPDAATRVFLSPSDVLLGAASYADITLLRVTVVDVEGDTLYRAPDQSVAPADSVFETTVAFRLAAPTEAHVVVELLSQGAAGTTVEYTVRIGPLLLEPGTTSDASDAPVLLVRGPLANAGVTGVSLVGPPSLVAGTSTTYRATLTGGGPGTLALWRVSDEAMLRVEPLGRDSARVVALAAGSAVLYADAGAQTDSVTIVVTSEGQDVGETLTWIGGAPGAGTDWFTPANWQPARVPAPLDSVYIPAEVQTFPVLTANAVVAYLESAFPGATPRLDLGSATLTVTGDVVASVAASAGGELVLIGDPVLVIGRLSTTRVRGSLDASGAQYVEFEGDLSVEGSGGEGELMLGDSGFVRIYGDLLLRDAHLTMGYQEDGVDSHLEVNGNVTFDGGNSAGAITGGEIYVFDGDFVVTDASCNAFVADPIHVVALFPLSQRRVSIACPGPDGNRFGYVEFSGADQGATPVTIELESDVYAYEFFPYYNVRLRGVGATRALRGQTGWLNKSTLDNVVVEVENDDPGLYPLYAQEVDTVYFVNIADPTRPQISVTHPGLADDELVYLTGIIYDSLSAAPYLRLVDSDGIAPLLWAAAGHNFGDAPERTETEGGAYVIWEGLPYLLDLVSGNGQRGGERLPLSQPLRIQVEGFWGECPFCEGYVVEWSVTSGGGSVSPATTTVGPDGLVETTWTLGDAGSPQEVVAHMPALEPFGTDTLVFTAVAEPAGAPAQ